MSGPPHTTRAEADIPGARGVREERKVHFLPPLILTLRGLRNTRCPEAVASRGRLGAGYRERWVGTGHLPGARMPTRSGLPPSQTEPPNVQIDVTSRHWCSPSGAGKSQHWLQLALKPHPAGVPHRDSPVSAAAHEELPGPGGRGEACRHGVITQGRNPSPSGLGSRSWALASQGHQGPSRGVPVTHGSRSK